MQKISCGHVAQNNLAVQSCFNTSLCGSSQRTSQHFSKTNSRINIKHLCVAPSLSFHGTWKQLFNIFFYQSSLKKLWRFLRTVQARSVWFGRVVCDTSHCLGSHWSLFVRSSYFFPFRLFISSPGLSGEFTPLGGKRFTSEGVKISSQLKQEQRTLSSLQNVCWNIKDALNVLFLINKSSLNLET